MDRIAKQAASTLESSVAFQFVRLESSCAPRSSAHRLDVAERIVRDYARCWGRLDRVVYAVSLAGFKDRYPDVPDREANECLACALLSAIAHEPGLFWHDASRSRSAAS